MKVRKPMGEKKLSPDSLMRKVAQTMIGDFRNVLKDPLFCSDHMNALHSGHIREIRETVPVPEVSSPDSYRFKTEYQVASLLKRYRFQKDLYSEQQLSDKSIQTFMETQTRIANVDPSRFSAFTNNVLRLAAIYVHHVLGAYDEAEHRSLCRFGKRASVGIPARLACEAARWELPISGSLNQINWFDAEMRHIDCVQEYWIAQLDECPNGSVYQPTDSLSLTLVPKTFKSLRSIMPNTTIGTYMSYGLGEIIRKRLKGNGYDIRSLQQTHKRLAQAASEHSLFTTADLSSASDSISTTLVELLFPKDWVDILNLSRIGTVRLPNGTSVESKTFCTMGVGYTFPLQTLVFLSLLKAIHFLRYGSVFRSTISVYGDDMIYLSDMHNSVVETFSQLGFVINLDKTFHEGWFRESCGGDYHRGVDVRPFQPQNGPATVGPKAYEAMLYKFVNGLLARWTEHEIGMTLEFLMSEIIRVVGAAKTVPCDFPDDSGIKISDCNCYEFLRRNTYVSWPKPIGHGVSRFSYLSFSPDKREEKRHEPYYWVSLRSGHSEPYISYGSGSRTVSVTLLQRVIEAVVGVHCSERELVTALVHPEQTFRSKLTGRRLRRTSTFVTVSHTGRYKRQTGTSCFGVP